MEPKGAKGYCEVHSKWNLRSRTAAAEEARRMMREKDEPFSYYRSDECGNLHVGRPRFGVDGYHEAVAAWAGYRLRCNVDRPLTNREKHTIREVVDVVVRMSAANIERDPTIRGDMMWLQAVLYRGSWPPHMRSKIEAWIDAQDPVGARDLALRKAIVRYEGDVPDEVVAEIRARYRVE